MTHGLNTSVRLKPSGVEWLGDVPEHWEVRRNGQLFVQRQETGYPELPILEVSLRTGIRVRANDGTGRKQAMSDPSKYKRALNGDLAYNMMRMWQGAVGVVPEDGLVSPAYIVAKPTRGTDSRYFCHHFRTREYLHEIDAYSRGIVKDRNRLYWEDFKQMLSLYPPPQEQTAIADAIEQRTESIQTAIAQVQREISLIRELRTRLIADVVSGKLDVRRASADLADEPAEDASETEEPLEPEESDELEAVEEGEGIEA